MTAKNTPAFETETRLALLEKTSEHIYEALTRFEKRFDKIDERFNRIDEHFDRLEAKLGGKIESVEGRLDKGIDKISSKITSRFFWLLAFVITGYGSLFAIAARGFHWF